MAKGAEWAMQSESDWDSLSWLQHVPKPSWPIPEDIMGPTRVPTTNLLVAILSEERIGNDVLEAVGELLAEEARFNVWYATRVNGRVPPEVQGALHADHGNVVQRIYEPWAAYRQALIAETEATRRKGELVPLSDAAYNALLDALRTVCRDIVKARRSLDNDG